MSLLCSTDTLRGEADCIACDGYVTTGRRLEDAADEIDQLRTENAELRELLQRTWNAFHDATAREFVGVKNELRELGVKVD